MLEAIKIEGNDISDEVNEARVASLMRAMDDRKHINSSDFVKVVCDKNNFALYFSRSIIPYEKIQYRKLYFTNMLESMLLRKVP